MTVKNEIVWWTGLLFTGILAIAGFLKKLRKDRTLFVLLLISIPIAVSGLLLRSPEYQMKGANGADILLGPFVYIVMYGGLRYVYKKIYKREPTYNRSSWYDPEEKREQNIMDVFAHVFPLMGAVLLPIIITAVLK